MPTPSAFAVPDPRSVLFGGINPELVNLGRIGGTVLNAVRTGNIVDVGLLTLEHAVLPVMGHNSEFLATHPWLNDDFTALMSNPLIPQSTKDGMWQRMSTDPLISGRISPFDPRLSLPEAPGTGILITPDESERLRAMLRLPRYIPVPVIAGLSGEAPGFEPVHTDRKDLITHTPVPILQGVDILSTPIHEQARQDHVLLSVNNDADKQRAKDIKKFGLDTNNPTELKILESLDIPIEEFIAKDRKASIKRELPREFLDSSLREVLVKAKNGDKKARTAKKLLTENRFLK